MKAEITQLPNISTAGFLKSSITGVISVDTSTYLTSVTAHNLLSTTHGDTLTDTVVRGDILVGNATPKWARLAFPATPTGKVLQATATDIAWSANPLGTAAFNATGDFLLAGGTAADSSKLGGALPAAYALVGQTMYIGTTAVAINRASASLALTGVTSIDGSSASCTGNSATATKSTNIAGGAGGSIPYQSSADNTSMLANGNTGQILRSAGTTAAPIWSTPTFPNTATSGKILVGDGTNIVLSTPTFPNASATTGKIIKSDGTNWLASTETYAAPGTSGNILTSDGTNWTSAAPAGGTPGFLRVATGTWNVAPSSSTFTKLMEVTNLDGNTDVVYKLTFAIRPYDDNNPSDGKLVLKLNDNGADTYYTMGYTQFESSSLTGFNTTSTDGFYVGNNGIKLYYGEGEILIKAYSLNTGTNYGRRPTFDSFICGRGGGGGTVVYQKSSGQLAKNDTNVTSLQLYWYDNSASTHNTGRYVLEKIN